jgi:signal recognition particle subunit SRP72
VRPKSVFLGHCACAIHVRQQHLVQALAWSPGSSTSLFLPPPLVLVRNPEDADALKVQCLCLIHQEKWDEALAVCLRSSDCDLERGYCLFRLGRFPEALATCEGASDYPALRQLHAQILYRMQKFSEAADIYEAECSSCRGGGDLQALQCNFYAACVAAGDSSRAMAQCQLLEEGELDQAHHELLYNLGTAYLERGRWAQAEHILKLAEEVCCRSLASEGCTESEVLKEVAAIKVQRACALYWLGCGEDAAELLKAEHQSFLDPSLTAAASNNLAAAQSLGGALASKEWSDIARRLKAAQTTAEADINRIQINRCTALIHAGRLKDAEEALDMMRESNHFMSVSLCILDAAIHFRAKRFSESESLLREALAKAEAEEADLERPGISWRLLLAHYKVLCGELPAGIELMHGALPAHPAVAATLARMQTAAGNSKAALSELSKGLDFFLSQPSSDSGIDAGQRSAALLALGHALLNAGEHRRAAEAFSSVLEGGSSTSSGDHLTALASMAMALSWFDPDGAEQLTSQLASQALLPEKEIDAATLESTELPRAPHSRKLVIANKVEWKTKEAEHKRRLKRRIKRREAFIASGRAGDPSTPLPPPDPERWVPTTQRSYARRPRKGKRVTQKLGAQGIGGGTTKNSAKLDAAAAAQTKSAKVAASGADETKA